MVVALDSNVFIAFIEQAQDANFFTAAAEIMKNIESGTLGVVYSSVVYGEVMRMPPGGSLEPIKQFLTSLGGKDYPADRTICIKAAELRLSYAGLKLPDALHLATALIAKADVFITTDIKLLSIAKQEMASVYLTDFTADE